MSLKFVSFIDLPVHNRPGGFDHAAVHLSSGRVYVAHTCNDALDVIDGVANSYLHSIPALTGVAGALVSDKLNLLLTSNRGEDTIGIFSFDAEAAITRVKVGLHPNGLAFDSTRNLLLAANVGDPAVAESFTVSLVDVAQHAMMASVPVPGRTRWAVYDSHAQRFYVNIMQPAQIAVVDATEPARARVERLWDIPVAGPHGLDLDMAQRRLYCACDAGKLVTLSADSGQVLSIADISGTPDVVFFNPVLEHLYIAIGDPGVIDVFYTRDLQRTETVSTEKGAHTLAFDAARNKVYAFLPQTHRAVVYADES